MTDQQPHTPTTEEVRLDYVMAYTDRESSQILAEQAFDRWLDERDARIIAAAEQRGAEDMLAFIIKNCPAYRTAEEVKDWMQHRLDLHRADQMEGDE